MRRLGSVERMSGMVAAQFRAFRLQLEEALKQRIRSDHRMVPWLVRHTTWLLTRFTVRSTGRTPFEALRGRALRGELVQMGENVLARQPGPREDKGDPNWDMGVYLGQTETSGEHLVSVAGRGAQRYRAIRRRVPSERFSAELCAQVWGAPWDLKEKPTEQGPGLHVAPVPEPLSSPQSQQRRHRARKPRQSWQGSHDQCRRPT